MRTLYSLLVLLLMSYLISCQKEEIKPDPTKGILHIDIGLQIDVKEIKKSLKSTEQTENFRVIIYNSDGTVKMSFEHAFEMPDTIELSTGSYYVEAHSDNNLPAAFENPYYYGKSEIFTIRSNMQESVRVNCSLANTIVSVVYSDSVRNSFIDYKTTVTSAAGSLIFLKDETRKGYFQTLPLEILAELKYVKPDGSQIIKTLTGGIPDPLPNRHYQILVNSSINEGMANIQIALDDTSTLTEIIQLSDTSASTPADEPAYGDLLITEIMFDPSALSDTYGEWFEIYNNSNRPVNLQNLIIRRDTVNTHTIADSVVLAPGAYYVFKRNIVATDVTSSYIYGSDISLPNTGAVLSIYNKGTEADPGALIFSVDYGGENFPALAGASISLNPNKLNAADAVSGTSWCTSTSTYVTGDRGTPGVINDPCQ